MFLNHFPDPEIYPYKGHSFAFSLEIQETVIFV